MENMMLIDALYNAYAGVNSEFTCINQYFYQSIIFDSNKQLHDIIERISIDEMKHLEELAKILKSLNFVPYLISYKYNNPIPWKSTYINYSTNLNEIINENIKEEKSAIENYNKIISLTNNRKIITTIQNIIEDELRHIELFKSLLPKTYN